MAMLAEETVLNPLAFRVEVVDDYVSIAGVTGCENNHFKMFTKVSENLTSIGSNINTSLDDLSCREFDGKFNRVRCI